MNVLLFTVEFPPFKGGVANYYENVVKHWPEPDNIFVFNNNENEILSNWIYPRWLPALWTLYKKIKTKKIDHILVGQILPLGTIAYLLSKMTKTPYSIFLHGTDLSFAQRTPRKKRLARKILRQAENIICSNSYTRKIAADFSEAGEKIHLVTPGVNGLTRLVKGDRGLNLNGKIVLFSLGRLVRRKGFDKVIAALPAVLKVVPNLIYVIAGTGPDQEYLRGKAKAILDRVIFLGEVTEQEKWTWLENCDIFITTSRNIDGDYEGFGIVYLEAGLAGKPVIAGTSGGVQDAVINNHTGLLVDPENIEEISTAIVQLAQDENLRKKLGEQGRERVIKEFEWKKRINEIYQIISLNKL